MRYSPVHRDEVARPDQVQHRAGIFPAAVTGDVHEGRAGVIDVAALAIEIADEP